MSSVIVGRKEGDHFSVARAPGARVLGGSFVGACAEGFSAASLARAASCWATRTPRAARPSGDLRLAVGFYVGLLVLNLKLPLNSVQPGIYQGQLTNRRRRLAAR
jgi:hypothetical protein